MLYQMVALLTPFITTPYLSRVLGAKGIGILSYTQSITSYFTMFAVMGVTIYATREISYVQDDPQERSRLFWEVVIFQLVNTIICSIVYLFFAFSQNEYQMIYYVLTFSIINVAADITWFYSGLEEFGKIVGRNLVLRIINIIYIFIVVKTSDDLLLYTIGIVVITLIGSISLWGYLPNYLVSVPWKMIKPWKNSMIIFSLFLPTIAIQVYTVMDKTILGMFTDTTLENGYYEQAMKTAKMGMMVVTSLGTVMAPRIGACYAKNEMNEVRYYMYRGYRFVWCLGILTCFLLIGVADNFVPWFFGNEFLPVANLLKVCSFLVLAIGINGTTGVQYLIPTMRQNVLTYTVVVGAITDFILNMIFIPYLFSMGAAIASVLTEITVAILQIWLVRKELSGFEILRSSSKYFLAGLVMIVVLFIENKFVPKSMIGTLCIILSGISIYSLILLILRDCFFCNNILKIWEFGVKKIKMYWIKF
jgi:O-antigen/teichoic acid export membrane protein